jgi:ankyrin repeat protein
LQTSGAHQELPDKWQLQGRYDRDSQQLTLSINNISENIQPGGAWYITGSTWSAGVNGQMPAHPTQIQYGDNLIPLNIEVATLTEAPSLKCVVQGPDNAFQTISIDLKKACAEQMNAQETALSEKIADAERYVQETHTAYQLPQETVDHPGVNRAKQAEIETFLGRLTAFYTGYQERLSVFENNLATLDLIQVSEHLPVFKKQLTELESSIASLKSSQVQLQLKCTTAHDALFKILEAEDGDAQAIETLIHDPKLDVNAKNEKGETALYVAAWKGNVEVAKLLLDRGVEINGRSNNGNTALIHAICVRRTEITRLLIERRAEVNVRGNNGNTALMCAARFESEEIVTLLIDRGAKVNTRSNLGYTALMCAVQHDRSEIVKLLIERGEEVNAKNIEGETALHEAAYTGNVEIARLLIEEGVEVNAKDKKGYTALMYAKQHAKVNFVKLLTAIGVKRS